MAVEKWEIKIPFMTLVPLIKNEQNMSWLKQIAIIVKIMRN